MCTGVMFTNSVAVATDLVYIVRHLLGLPPVPPSFRSGGSPIPPDEEIVVRVDALRP